MKSMVTTFFQRMKAESKTALLLTILFFSFAASQAKDLPPFNFRLQSTNASKVLVGTSTATGIIDANPKTGSFNDTRVLDLLTLAYDHAKDTFLTKNIDLKVKFSILAWDANNNPITLANPSPVEKISIHPFADNSAAPDKFVHYFNGAYKFQVTIDSIYINGVSTNFLPSCFYVEEEIQISRFYDFTSPSTTPVTINSYQALDLDCDGNNDEIQVNWATVPEAEEYQLEWTFINDYGNTVVSSTMPTTALNYDFRGNATRITTKDNSYKISLIYERGYLLYRVRAVGRDYLAPQNSIFSPWSLNDHGTVANGISQSANSVYNTNVHEGGKNWQYTSSFAEEGKKKEVIKYFDGSLRNRQAVTKMNSDKNVIVGETIYDNQGRPAVNVLPVPVDMPTCSTSVEPSIKYYFNFNSDDTLKPYSRNDFDMDGNSACNVIAAPMDSIQSGAAHYYSEANPNKNAQQAYLPNSFQFPFTQTEYTPDNTGRIRTQGGVGREFQIGTSSSHATKYFYGQPNQLQVDRLFGSEAGDASHYKKNVVFDANGQASVTYLDQEGRTIATALAGNPPKGADSSYILEPLASSNTLDTLTIDLFNKDVYGNSLLNAINISNDAVEFNSQLLVTYNSLYNFSYNLSVDTLFDPCLRPNVCFNCIYDLTLKISDECGNDLIPTSGCNSGQPLISKTVGKFVDNAGNIQFQSLTNCTSPDTFKYAFNCPIQLSPGNYTLTKTLAINKQARDTIVKRYLDTAYNSCVKSLHNFQQAALASVDTNSCKTTCDSCAANLGTRDNFVSSGKGTAMMYDFLLQQCIDGCAPLSVCQETYQQLLLDIYPSGQYAEYDNNSNVALVSATNYPLSVLDTTNSLPVRSNFGSAHSNWKYPRLMLNNNIYNTYIDDNGNPSIVIITVTTSGGSTFYSPDVTHTNAVVLDSASGNYVTPPENLKYLGDFVSRWQDSWAQSLVTYHPEYPYYLACKDYNTKLSGDNISSDGLDDQILHINTFSAAVSAGFIKSNYLTLPTSSAQTNSKADNLFTQSNAHPYDPFVTNAYFNSFAGNPLPATMFTQLNAKYLNYMTVGGNSYSMPEVAAIVARCGTQYNTVSTSCTYFGTNISVNPTINDSVRNKEWNIFKNLYISAKQAIQQGRSDYITLNSIFNDKGYNGCIGASSFNPSSTGMINYSSYFSSPYFDPLQPCYYGTYALYASKAKRYLNAADIAALGNANSAGLQNYLQTGQCPLATDVQNFLSAMAYSGKLTTTTSDYLYNHAEFTPAMYGELAGTSSTFINYYWKASISGNVLTGIIYAPPTSPVCTTTLDISGSGITSWSSIVGFEQLTYTGVSGGLNQFTITAKVQVGINQYVYKHLTGGTCFQLNGCKFQPVCNANTFAVDVSNLMGALAANGNLTSSNFTLNGSYIPLVTQSIANALNNPYPGTGNYTWSYNGSNFFELYNSNYPGKIRIRANATIPAVTLNAATFNNIKSFTGMVSNYQNLFKLNANNASGVNQFIIYGATDLINGSSTTGISMGDCALPQSFSCQDQAVQITTDLAALLKDVLTKKPFTGNIDLFTSNALTNLLKSNLPAGITSTSSTDNNNSSGANPPYYDTLTFTIPGCSLRVWEKAGSTSPSLYLSQLVDLYGIKAIGTTDGYGYFHNFGGIGVFQVGSQTFTDSIFGTTCLNLKNCISCGDGSPGAMAGGRMMNTTSDPPLYVAYSRIIEKLNKRLSVEKGMEIQKMPVQLFPATEFGKYLFSFEDFTKKFDLNFDKRSMVENIDTFMLQYGNYNNCVYQYERYQRAVTEFNKQSATQRSLEPVHVQVVSQEEFVKQELCDNTGQYISYLQKIQIKNETPVDLAEFEKKSTNKKSNTEKTRQIFERYKEKYANLTQNQKLDLATVDALTPQEIEARKLYASQSAESFIRAWLENINFQSPNATTNNYANAKIEPCTNAFITTQAVINAYNSSAYAIAHNYTLSLYPDTTAVLFTNAGYCNCSKNYQGYLGQYINAGANSNLPLPVSLSHYPGCETYISNVVSCRSAYDSYTHAVQTYNATHTPAITPYPFTAFQDSGYCNCVEGYLAFMQGVNNGTVVDPNLQLDVDMANFCKDTPPPCNQPPLLDTLTTPTVQYQNPCVQQMINQALANAQNAYNQYIDSLTTYISNAYTQHCLHAFESYTAKYNDKEYHFTLYYYDQAGNLIKTVPPEGVEPLNINAYNDPLELNILSDRASNMQTVFTEHRLPTIYEYNSLNQLIRQNIPDHDLMTITEYDLPNGLDNRLVITSTQFVNNNKGFLTGYITMPTGTLRGYLYTTDDGGQNWNRMYDFVCSDLQKVQMVNQRVGFATGTMGVVMKTIDGGNSWDMITLYRNKFTEQLNDLYFTDTLHGVLAGNNGKILSTVNGISFNLYLPTGSSPNGFAATDTITGLSAIGNTFYATVKNGGIGKMYYSTNTGQTWTLMSNISVSQNLNKVQYITANVAYAVGDDGVLLKKNAANNWQIVPTGLNKKLLDIYFKDASNGVAIVDNATNGYGTIWKTFNGGITWIQMTPAIDQYTHFYEYDHANGKAMAGGMNNLVAKVLLTTPPFGVIKLITTNISPVVNFNFVAAEPNVVSGQANLSVVGIDYTSQKMQVAINGEDPFQNWFSVTAVPSLNPPTGNLRKVILQNAGQDKIVGVVLYQTGEVYTIFKKAGVQTFTVMPAITTTLTTQISEIQRQGNNTYFAFNKLNGQVLKFKVTQAGTANPVVTLLAPVPPLAPFSTINSMALFGGTNPISIVGNSGQSAVYVPTPVPHWVSTTNKVLPGKLNDISNNTNTNNYAVGSDGNVWTCVSCTTSNSWKLIHKAGIDEYNGIKINNSFNDPGLISTSGGKLFRHNVVGNTLTLTNIPLTQTGVVKDIALSNTNQAYLATTSGKVVHLNNIFLPVQVNTAPVSANYQVNGISFAPVTNQVIAVGTNSGVFEYFGNSGARIKELFTNVLRDVHFTDINNGYVVGDSGVVRHTQNSGSDWKLVLPDLGSGPPNIITRLNPARVWTHRPDVAIIVGMNNYVAQINNTTPAVTIPVPGTLIKDFRAIRFNNSNYGVIGGTKAVTYMIVPVGNTFSLTGLTFFNTNPTTLVDINGLHVFIDNSFMAVGTKGAIGYYKASIGSFKVLNAYPAYSYSQIGSTNLINFNDVFFHDDRTGYVVGDKGIAIKCNLSQNIQTQVTPTSPPTVVPWDTLSLSDRFGIYTNATKGLIDIKTVDFVTRYDGFLGGNFNDGRLRKNYSMLIHDEGGYFSIRFWYDRLGRLTVSQNTKQKNQSSYSYTMYDFLGRIKEVGKKHENSSTQIQFPNVFGTYINNYLNLNAIDDGKLTTWIGANGLRSEVTKTFYDTQSVIKPLILAQQNLRKRVASITYEDNYDGYDTTYQHATHFTYDVHGNVSTLIQENPSLTFIKQQYKRIDYEYDLISGKVNNVYYEKDSIDAFSHHYEYDADNRITQVYTTHYPSARWIGVQDVFWDNDAKYFYYDHGALARVEYGDNHVQGLDYAYTLQGWIKGMNSENLKETNDIGKDGWKLAGNPHSRFAKDAFGYSLTYFQQDYKAISWTSDSLHRFVASQHFAPGDPSDLIHYRSDLYNGNIGTMVASVTNPQLRIGMGLATSYKYDQLNRLVRAASFDQLLSYSNEWNNENFYYPWESFAYLNTFSYDASGNILSQMRSDANGVAFDSLTYQYMRDGSGKLLQNRLYHVNDKSAANLKKDDINDEGVFNSTIGSINLNNNYGYDAIGNLAKDSAEGIRKIDWTNYGKIRSVTHIPGYYKLNGTDTVRPPDLFFNYDASGNRISKIVKPRTATGVKPPNEWKSEFYVRDAQGNILSTYKEHDSTSISALYFTQTEKHIYGSSHIGSDLNETELIGTAAAVDTFARKLGKKQFELTNHLGSVIETISDKKIEQDPNNVNAIYSSPDVSRTGIDSLGGMKIRPLVIYAGVNFTFRSNPGQTYQIDFYYNQANTDPNPVTGDDPNFAYQTNGNYVALPLPLTGHYSVNSFATDTLTTFKPLYFAGNNTPNHYFLFDSLKVKVVGSTKDTVENYVSEIMSISDLSSFGAPLEDRQWRSSASFASLNGKRKDSEIYGEGNFYDYGMRNYDPRLGRAPSIDPLTAKYPSLSPYQFFSNNPILFVDRDGLEGVQYLETTTHKDGTTTTQRIVELDVWVGVTSQEGNAHYKATDVPDIQKGLDEEYNTGKFKDSEGHQVVFRFNMKTFDADNVTMDKKGSELRHDPNNYEKAKGKFNKSETNVEGSTRRGIVLIRDEIPTTDGDQEGGTTNIVYGTTQIHKHSDNKHTRAHEIAHQFLRLDPKNPGTTHKFMITQHKKYGGIFKYEEKIKETGEVKPGSELENVTPENVKKILEYVPEKGEVKKSE